MKITDIKHPLYTDEECDWEKFRLVYEGGRRFIDAFLEKLSLRENETDFATRRKLTYSAAHAKSAINEIKNVIFNRLRDVTRVNANESYNQAIQGKQNGVDNAGCTMDYFIGQYVLPELLTMRRVGVYVDMPSDVPETLVGSDKVHPYIYLYKTEDIKSWSYAEPSKEQEFKSVWLKESVLSYDEAINVPCGDWCRYRYAYLNKQGTVSVEFYNEDGDQINIHGVKSKVVYNIGLKHIPFVMFEIQESLLKDAADYQIALLNMESADVAYAIQANFPLYVEQKEEGINQPADIPTLSEEGIAALDAGETDINKALIQAKSAEIKVGPMYGKKYPKGANAPSWIAPSPEPLKAAMDKEMQIKKDIKLLINLAVTDLTDKMVSEGSKKIDESGKQTGLACIAYVLEHGERQIAKFWNAYNSKTNEASIVITYPKDYDLKSDDQRRQDCVELYELMERIPSRHFKIIVLQKIVEILLSSRIPDAELKKIKQEIEKSKGLIASVEQLVAIKEAGGAVSDETFSLLLGFAEGESKQAAKDHAETLARISKAQGDEAGAARGVSATQTGQRTSSQEKKGKTKRGKAT